MSDEHETTEALIAEYRADADKMDTHELPQPTTQYLRIMLDRLEAAMTRERAKIEADALEVGGIVEAAHRRELSKNVSKNEADFGQLGDAAKLREALKRAWLFISATRESFAFVHEGRIERDKLCEDIDAALSAPPRNCDLARDWMRDLYAHFQPPASVKREMPPEWVDAVMAFCRWLVAPATEKEGGDR